MQDGTSHDFTESVWTACYQLPQNELTEVIQNVIKHIPEYAERLIVDDSNMSSLAMRVIAIKKGKRSLMRRVSESEAVEMLIECGGLYLDSALLQVATDAYEINQLVKEHTKSDEFESQVKYYVHIKSTNILV